MIKWHSLGLILLVLMFAGCASKSPKKTEVVPVAKVPPPIFGSNDFTGSPEIITDADVASEMTSSGDMSIPELRIIYFNYDMSDITSKSRTVLEEHAMYISNFPETTVRLEGHADERGSREYNIALGERRVEEAKNALINLGIMDSQIEGISYGEEQPAVAGHNERSWWQNRRVEFVYP